MKKKHAQKTSRIALFTENERDYLHGKKSMSTVMKSQFHHNLDIRFNALLKDLELIHKTEILNGWKSTRAYRYTIYFKSMNYFLNLFSNIEQGYQSTLRHIQSGKGKNKKHRYWLDHSPLKDNKIDERIFNKDFLFRHIRSGLTDNDKKLLLAATNNQGILSTKMEGAITIEEIKKRLSGESKVRTNITQIKNVTKETFKDLRNFEIYSIIEKHEKRSIKSLNKKLSKFDSKIIQYFVNPYFHAESE
jgi:hypothetical protein